MGFSNEKAIYMQMADRLCDEIISGHYAELDRIPSVRDYAILLEVNTNTAVKTYEFLARDGIIFNKRGLGYFVSQGARQRIVQARQRDFLDRQVPELFRQMDLLGIGVDKIVEEWKKHVER